MANSEKFGGSITWNSLGHGVLGQIVLGVILASSNPTYQLVHTQLKAFLARLAVWRVAVNTKQDLRPNTASAIHSNIPL